MQAGIGLAVASPIAAPMLAAPPTVAPSTIAPPAIAPAAERRTALMRASPPVPPSRDTEAATTAVAHRQKFGLSRESGLRRGGRGRRRVGEPGDPEQSDDCGNCQGFRAHEVSFETNRVRPTTRQEAILFPTLWWDGSYPEAPREVAAESTGA
jgi:hypothetical protein